MLTDYNVVLFILFSIIFRQLHFSTIWNIKCFYLNTINIFSDTIAFQIIVYIILCYIRPSGLCETVNLALESEKLKWSSLVQNIKLQLYFSILPTIL